MTFDNLPNLPSPDYGWIQDSARPILCFSWQEQAAHRAAAHSHPRGHIIHCENGTCWVRTPEGSWLVPPGQAIWVPPDLHHEVFSSGPVKAHVLFVDATHANRMPTRCGTVVFSKLLSELLRRMVSYGNEYASNGGAARLALVILDELAVMELAPMLLPVAEDQRLIRVMEQLIREPDAQVELEQVARNSGSSPRTLARLFRSETGMTFTQWKTRLLLTESVERLSRGASVTTVALDLGYATTSSFVHMFRSNMGISPGRYGKQ